MFLFRSQSFLARFVPSLVLILTAWIAVAANRAAAVTLNDFQSGTSEGWQQGGAAAPLSAVADSGPSGLGDFALQVVADAAGSGGKLVFFNNTPQWTGDYTAQNLSSIEGVLLNDSGQSLSLRAAIDGPGGKFATTNAIMVPSSSDFQDFTLDLLPSNFTAVDGATDLTATLESVTTLRLLHNPSPAWRGVNISGTFLFDSGPLIPPSLQWNQESGTYDFDDKANWLPAQTPTATDDVLFGPGLGSLNVKLNLTADSTTGGKDMTFTQGIVRLNTSASRPRNLTNNGQVTIDDAAAASLPSGALVTYEQGVWDARGNAIVGDLGYGRLSLIDFGNFQSTNLLIGDGVGGTGQVNIIGESNITNSSTVTAASTLTVGNAGVGSLVVEDGGTASSKTSFIAALPGSTGTVSVDGRNSRWANAQDLFIGGNDSAAGGTASLTVTDQAVVDVARTLKTWNSAAITLDGGAIVTQTFDHTDGGAINFVAGSLTINDGLTIGNDPAGVFPGSFSVDSDQQLITSATTTVDASRTLVLNGGGLRTRNLSVNGSFLFQSGVLELTGGSVTGLPSLTVPTNGTLQGTGAYNLPVSATSGSTLLATGPLTLGNASNPSGFYSNGHVDLAGNQLSLDDANDVVFDSGASVELGDDGSLNAANGLTLDFGGNITGFGTISTPDDPTTPLTNNAHIAGISMAKPITLTGYVKGVGTCDNCNITGTDSPGFSPATVNRGSVSYNGTLQIEIGGTSLGSFDQLNHILGAGVADLGGTLEVQLIGDFVPGAGDSFEFLTAMSVAGEFDTTLLPVIGGGLSFDLVYEPDSVMLAVVGIEGDYNFDGTVNAADYTVWRDSLGATGEGLAADGDQSGVIDAGDYTVWKSNFGFSNSGGLQNHQQATVPEPMTSCLLIMGLAAVMGWRRK